MYLDRDGLKKVEKMIARVRDAGLSDEAKVFSTSYWAWIRITEAYVCAHPYVAKQEKGMTPISALTVVDFTFNHWANLIPGSPKLNDEKVLEAAARDEAWHLAEDLRMRREAGDDI